MVQQRTTESQTPETNLQLLEPPTSQPPSSAGGQVHPLLHVQQTIGNRAVQGLLQVWDFARQLENAFIHHLTFLSVPGGSFIYPIPSMFVGY